MREQHRAIIAGKHIQIIIIIQVIYCFLSLSQYFYSIEVIGTAIYSIINNHVIFFFSSKFALVIILTRAGLDLDPAALKRLKITVPKMGLIPWFAEAAVIAVLSKYLLGLPWIWGILLGSIVSAVSPAVVVPCLFRLRSRGYGVAKVYIYTKFYYYYYYHY